MKKSSPPAYFKRERLSQANLASDRVLPADKLSSSAEKLRQVLMDPNQTPVMEVFIELE